MNLVTFYGPMTFFHSVASWQLEAIDTDIRLSREIIDVSQADPAAIWQLLRTSPDGLTQQEANARLELIGVTTCKHPGAGSQSSEGRAQIDCNWDSGSGSQSLQIGSD
jgi:hypothetical protein